MGSCVSTCGCCVDAASESYESIAVAFPWLHLPKGKTPKSDGILVVQIIRDVVKFPKAPVVSLEDDKAIAQLFNIAGHQESLTDQVKDAQHVDSLAKAHAKSDNGGQSIYLMVLMKDRPVDHVTLVIDWSQDDAAKPTKGAPTTLFKLPLNDPTVVVTTSTSAAFNTGSKGASSFHPQTVGTDGKFSLSVVRYNVLPNQRYPYNKKDLQGLIEGTKDSDFNPYPKPINHISDNGKLWVNWGQTLAARPNRVYSDGAIQEGKKVADYPSPRTLDDCRAIVAYARSAGLNVRVFGSNHSWAPVSSTDGVLVDNRQLNCIKPEKAGFDPLDNGKEWPGYTMILNKQDNDLANGNPTVYFPPGICTGDLERWIQVNGGYRMPTSTVEDVFTMGGIIAMGCHGTGKLNPTINDWVVAMEFVDWDGKLQRITRKSCPKEYLQLVRLNPNDPNTEVQLDEEDIFNAMLMNMGSFGIIWSYTMRVYPPAPIYLIAKTVPWKSLFDDTQEARDNLAKLQSEYETFECFYFPFRFTGKIYPTYEENPQLYIWLGGTKKPEGYNVYKPTDDESFGQDLIQHMGIFMLGKLFSNAAANPALYAMMPYLASMMYLNLLLTVDKEGKECAWEIPQWRESHPFNAIGSVEGVPCCDIEWAMKCNVKQGGAGFLHPNRAYGDIIRAIHAAHQSSSNPFDMARFPVTITAEMRIFHGSGALMSPEYYKDFNVDDTSNGEAYCAPEIVTHAGNAGWDKFYKQMNDQMIDPKNADRYGLTVRPHQAKEFSVLPGMLSFVRKSYRAESYKKANPFDYFKAIRDVIDPTRMFVNPYLKQFLYSEDPTYTPPKNLPIFTRGQIERLDPNSLKCGQ